MPGPDNDLNERIDAVMSRALADEEALVYAFGQRWGPEPTRRTSIFGFLPGNGIHDIHMNQGNTGQFAQRQRRLAGWRDARAVSGADGVPEQWVGVFLAFQSQAWHTDDVTGNALPEAPVGEQPGEPVAGTTDAAVYIAAALVNPIGPAPERETVTLINRSPLTIDLAGWALANRNESEAHAQRIDRRGPDAGRGACRSRCRCRTTAASSRCWMRPA